MRAFLRLVNDCSAFPIRPYSPYIILPAFSWFITYLSSPNGSYETACCIQTDSSWLRKPDQTRCHHSIHLVVMNWLDQGKKKREKLYCSFQRDSWPIVRRATSTWSWVMSKVTLSWVAELVSTIPDRYRDRPHRPPFPTHFIFHTQLKSKAINSLREPQWKRRDQNSGQLSECNTDNRTLFLQLNRRPSSCTRWTSHGIPRILNFGLCCSPTAETALSL